MTQPAGGAHWASAAIAVLLWTAIWMPSWLRLGLLLSCSPMIAGPIAVMAVATASTLVWRLFDSRPVWAGRFLVLPAFGMFGALAFFSCNPVLEAFVLTDAVRAVTTAWVGWALVGPSLSRFFKLGT